MVNSIRDRLDEKDTISEIVLTLNHRKNNVCVVVEGVNDQKLFRPLFSNNVEIFQSYSSNIGVDNVVTDYFYGNKRVLGIRDRDYLVNPINDQCFFCDYCCAEMMIVSIDDCFDRVYSNCYNAGRMNSEEVRLHCLERLEMLSKFRKLNYIFDWKIRFDGIKPSKLYEKNIDAMNMKIIEALNESNPDNKLDKNRIDKCKKMAKCKTFEDYLQITNGHDFINLFCKVSSNRYGEQAIKTIESTLRVAFSIVDFEKTKLFKDLLEYQSKYGLEIIKTNV